MAHEHAIITAIVFLPFMSPPRYHCGAALLANAAVAVRQDETVRLPSENRRFCKRQLHPALIGFEIVFYFCEIMVGLFDFQREFRFEPDEFLHY